MKIKQRLIYVVLGIFLLSSCVTTNFHQVYKVQPADMEVKEQFLIYEDENCIISYRFWSEGGNAGFKIFNKTDNDLFLNLKKSFFVLNGVAYDYYLNRVFSNSTTSGISTSRTATASKSATGVNQFNLLQTNLLRATSSKGLTTSSGYSISYNEQKYLCIPSQTSKVVSEYNVNKELYRDCDLFRHPKKSQINTKTFSRSDSPIVFSNRITYAIEEPVDWINVKNEFYVSEITNYPNSEFFESKYEEFCGQKSTNRTRYFKNVSPDKFYITYSRIPFWHH